MLNWITKWRNQKGFTLIELIVVISIIAVLALIAVPQFSNAQASARGARVVADLRTIDSAIMMAQANGIVATTTNLVPDYLAAMPVAPTSGVIKWPNPAVANGAGAAGTTYTIGTAPAPVAGGAASTALRALYDGKPVEYYAQP
jgi:prepilin-type N-terminal cleavage/methylation domain-containing protein